MKKGIKIALKIIVLLFAVNVFMNSKVNAETTTEVTTATESANGFEWTYTVEDGKAVDVYISKGVITDTITVPAELGGYPVARIGSGKANYNLVNNVNSISVTTIYLPETLEEIGDYAFRTMQYVRTVGLESNNTTLPNITRIGNYAFQNCNALTEINLPDTLVSIDMRAFYGCTGITEIELPNTITSIGDYAFGNTGLSEIPDGLFDIITDIPAGMFQACSKMTDITIPEGVTSIGNNAFQSCANLTNIELPSTLTSVGNYAFSNCQKITNITIPEGLTNIGNNAFQSCTNLTNIELPNTITSIGDYAFNYCNKLIEMNIPDSVVSIGNYAFQNCTSLSSINIGSGITKILNYALFNIKDVYINKEEGTVEIGEYNNGTIHYANCKHKYNISSCEGTKIINTDTNEEIPNGILEIECGESLNYKITIDGEVAHDNLYYTVSTKPLLVYSYNPTQPNVNVESIKYINEETTGAMSNVLRDGQIVVQNIKTGADLVLRKYITKVNGIAIKQDRQPVFGFENGERAYKHTKTPVAVNSGDIVRYTIRVYNEGTTNGYAKEITEYLPEYLEFVSTSGVNSKYGWVASEDGKTIKTNYLQNIRIDTYGGSLTTINYKEIEIECRVLANRDEDNKYIASITEITNGDVDSTPGNITTDMLDEYKFEESLNSNSNSYIHGEEDDFDYECILVPTISDISTDYRIRIEKIDALTGELLNGAKFNLLNEAGEVLKEGVTAVDGVLDFGMMNSIGEGTDTYYVEEVERPEGYSNPVTYKIKLTVTKEIYDYINQKYTLDVKCDIADIDVDITRYDAIPIYTKDQLIKIGSNEEVYIEEVDETFTFDNSKVYKLMQDIDLTDQEWKPLNVEDCMLDGNNFAVKNLRIEKNITTATNIGLFGAYSGYIGNLNLENVNIRIGGPSSNLDHGIGGLVGYMSEGIIKNCNVTGTITSSSENVGGFVGHSEKKKILIFNNCTNGANVTANQNIGGLIGCAKGAINISGCTNIGEITLNGSGPNVGGLIGCVDPEGYESNFVKASYDRENKIITLVVQNDSIIGKYKLRLENVDIQTLKLIEGSTFDILDKDKNVVNGYKGVVLRDGKLDVATIDITTIGTDVYYIKQIATPEGYEISTNEYVKVIVNKKWDTVNDRYVVDVDTTTINDEDYEIDEIVEDVSSSKTGIIHKIMEYKNVTWTTNKVGIKDSRNEGDVVSNGGYNAAGLVGRGKTSIEINNCENIGSVTSVRVRAGGLVGEITKESELSYVKIYNSNNKGVVTNHNAGSFGSATEVAGIIAYSQPDIIIENCSNENSIISDRPTTIGGIIGNSASNISVYSSNNSGNLSILQDGATASGSNVGGIIGQTKSYIESENAGRTIIIDNCINTGNISNGGDTGGMIGFAEGELIKVTNCNIQESTLDAYSGDIGGMIGAAWCKNVIIENCNMKDTNILEECISTSNSYGNTGGMVGYVNGSCIYPSPRADNVSVKNCTVSDSNINTSKDIGGILGNISADNITIEDCDVTDTTINNLMQPSFSTYGTTGGILAYVGNSNSPATTKALSIKNCNVSNSEITSIKDTGGIVGAIIQAGDNIEVNIIGCTVDNTDIVNKGSTSTTYSSSAGILCNGYSLNKLLIKDCNVNNGSSVKSYSAYSSGNNCDTAGILANVNSIKEVIIENCDVSDIEIENRASADRTANTSGIVASTNDIKSIKILNCDVDKVNAHALSGNTAGILAGGYQNDNNVSYIKSCNINDSTILSEATYQNSDVNSNTSGIIATSTSKIVIDDCNVDDVTIEGRGINIAGILGYNKSNGNNAEILNCSVNNCIITDENMTLLYQYFTRGGISGTTYGAIYDNCIVKDTEIHATKATSIGGIAGINLNASKIENCTVEGTNIYAGSLTIGSRYGNDTVGGIIGDINYNNNLNGEFGISNCTVKDVNIESTTDNISGIVGTTNVSMEINDCVIENVDLIQKNENSKIGPYQNYPRTVGGILSVLSNKMDSTNLDNEITINNPIIKDLDIIVKSGVDDEIQTGGIIGYAMKATIDNANIGGTTIKGINIENNTSKGVVGGIAGIVVNPYETATEENPEITITNSTISNTILKGMHLIEKYVGCSTVSKIDDTNSNTAEIVTIEQTTNETQE